MPDGDETVHSAWSYDDARLSALASYDILDTPAEQTFDDLTLLAARICNTPVALVSLIDQDRQWFKARIGFPSCETDLNRSVCKFVLDQPDVLVIPSLTADSRTRDNPLVTGDPFLRFYAGAPLRTPGGVTIGSLCVIDKKPRPDGLSENQREALKALARQVITLLELRRQTIEQARLSAALEESEARHRGALKIARLGTYDWKVTTGALVLNERSREIFNFVPGEGEVAQDVFDRIDPDDFPSIYAAAMASAAALQPIEMQYRIRLPGGEVRTVFSQGEFLAGPDGKADRALGVFADMTDRVRADTMLRGNEQQLDSLMQVSSEVRYRLNADWSILYELTGGSFIANTSEGRPMWMEAYIPPSDRSLVQTEIARAISTKSPFNLEHQVYQVDGTIGWASSRAVPVLDDADLIVAWNGAASDITARRQAEIALQDLNTTLEQRVEDRTRELDRAWRLSPELLVIASPDGMLEAINPTWTTLLGWSEEEMIGSQFMNLRIPMISTPHLRLSQASLSVL